MAIIFHDTVSKAVTDKQSAREYLLSYLDPNEPALMQVLYRLWNHQGKAITYKEIREMILSGYLDEEIINQWHQDYSRFVIEHIKPMYEDAMAHAVKPLEEQRAPFKVDFATKGIEVWARESAAKFVTRCTSDQISALRFVVARATRYHMETNANVDNLARVIRPMVGLNRPQAVANMNYYMKLIQSGMQEKKAVEMSIKYAAKQHRYRGHMIARTEMAFAHNKGEHYGVEQAIKEGYMGRTVKIWTDAGDDRVCETCRRLDRESHARPIDFDGHFNFPTRLKQTNFNIDLTPPAHPHCRCAVIYKELEPPKFPNN